jgi:hypothetical protein
VSRRHVQDDETSSARSVSTQGPSTAASKRLSAVRKHSHERRGQRGEPLTVGLERARATAGGAKHERQNVEDRILAEPAAHAAHLPRHGLERPCACRYCARRIVSAKQGGTAGCGVLWCGGGAVWRRSVPPDRDGLW